MLIIIIPIVTQLVWPPTSSSSNSKSLQSMVLDGITVGLHVGTFVGVTEGLHVGSDGTLVGFVVGSRVGTHVGFVVGLHVGTTVGFAGIDVGFVVGWHVGTLVGFVVGRRVVKQPARFKLLRITRPVYLERPSSVPFTK